MAKKQLTSTFNVRSTGLNDSYFPKGDTKINYTVIRLVLYGFSTMAIANYTGLTYAQVQYRIRMYKLQGVRAMFRMGETKEAKIVKQKALRVSPTTRANEKDLYQNIRDSILAAYKKNKALN